MTKLLSILALLLMGMGTKPAVFCSCLPKQPVEAEYNRSDLVALGEVLKVEVTEEQDRQGIKNVRFKVERAFKGAAINDTLNIRTGLGGGDCGVHFEEGGQYIVYASADEKIFWTNICTRTTPCKDQELQELEGI